ncbi:PEP/pyruvate-binding domain-containing protein, partial [Methylibium sp. T29]
MIQEIDGMDTAKFGGKATGLARMAAAGLPVPPAFVIGTDAYRVFRETGDLPPDLLAQVDRAMRVLESRTS